eukprot:s562_g36.t1
MCVAILYFFLFPLILLAKNAKLSDFVHAVEEHYDYFHSAQIAQAEEGIGKTFLALAQNRTSEAQCRATEEDPGNTAFASFERPSTFLRLIAAEMSKQQTQQGWFCQTCRKMRSPLAWYCDLCGQSWEDCIGETKSSRKKQQTWQNTYAHWEEEDDWGRGRRGATRSASGKRGNAQRGRGDTPRQPSRRPKGKGKGKQEHQSPFQPIGGQPPPWPSQDSAHSGFATSSPFGPLAPPPPPALPPPPSNTQDDDAQLIFAVKEEYPDLSQAPANIRAAVEKAEKRNTNRIAADLHRTTQCVKKATERLRELKESQIRHKESWRAHLQEALTCWEGQVRSYTSQQASYKEMVLKTREEIQAARKDIQRLNNLVAGTSLPSTSNTVDLTEQEVINIDDSDNLALMHKMQATLQQCAQLFQDPPADAARAVSVPSEEEGDTEMGAPASKRPRSADPGPGALPKQGSGVPIEVTSIASNDFLHYQHEGPACHRLADSHYVESNQYTASIPAGLDHNVFNLAEQDLPPWAPNLLRQLQVALQERGLQVHEDGLRLRTWFLHHRDFIQCQRPRFVELAGFHAEWLRDITAAWQDLIHVDQWIDFHLVQPPIPLWNQATDGEWLPYFDVILSQGSPDWRASLVAIYPGFGRPQRLIAISLQQFSTGIDILEASDPHHHLEGSTCRLYHGWNEIPLDYIHFHRVEDGQSLAIHVAQVEETTDGDTTSRVPFAPYEAFFRRVRALIGLRHHDVSRILQITPTPADLASIATTPLLVLRHEDLFEGDFRRAALVDVEHHGSTFTSVVETDRFVIKLPDLIHRSNLLAWVRVDRYCQAMRDKCLVWHKGQLVPHQSMELMEINHGDYIRIAIPPFRHQEVPTQLATECLQAGFTVRQTLHRYQTRGDDTASLYSLIDGSQPDGDTNTLMQLPVTSHASNALAHEMCGPNPFNALYGPAHTPWKFHLMQLLQDGPVECQEEGPVGYIDTWLLRGHHSYTTEHVRTYRCLLEESAWWYEDLLELWANKIDRNQPISFFWVHPVPRSDPLRQRDGHLLLAQDLAEHLVPTHLTIEFWTQHNHHLHHGDVAALLPNPVSLGAVRDLARLSRNCLVKRCSLHQGDSQWQEDEERQVHAGAGLTFKLSEEHLVEPHLAQQPPEDQEEIIPAQPPLAAQSPFTRRLFEVWDQQAIFGPAHLERLLRVETWYLEGRFVKIHDEHRNIILADDYWEWEEALKRRWRDFILVDHEVNFALVTPTPPTAQSPQEVHIILHQRIFEFDHPNLVTVVDNGILRGEPYTTAVILPSACNKFDIIDRTGKTQYCPPHAPTTTMCHCWHQDRDVDHQPYPNRDGYAYDLHVYRQLPDHFWSDNEGDPDAASSVSLLQLHSSLHREEIPGERLTTGTVAHAQWPPDLHNHPTQRIDLHQTIEAFEIFDSHFSLPQLDLPDLPEDHIAYSWTTT